MESFLMLLLCLVAGCLGILGGGALPLPGSKFAARLLTGAILGWLLSGVNPWLWLYALYFPLGAAPGPGQPEGYAILAADGQDVERIYMDKALEWWQPEALRFHPYWSLALRGALYLNPSHVIANPGGMVLGLLMPRGVPHMDRNRWHEFWHYALAVGITAAATGLGS